MFVDYMHQPWRTLAAIINKCLSGKTTSNERLRKSIIEIRWGEEVQEYGRAIPDTMLTKEIKKSEAYKAFIDYFTGVIPPKKTRGKSINWTEAEEQEEAKRVHETYEHLVTEKLATADTMQAIKASKMVSKSSLHTQGSSKGAGITPEVLDESAVIFTTSSEGSGIKPGVLDEVKGSSEAKVDFTIDWGSKNESDYSEEDKVDKKLNDYLLMKKKRSKIMMTMIEALILKRLMIKMRMMSTKDDAANADANKTEEVNGADTQARIEVAKVDQAKDTNIPLVGTDKDCVDVEIQSLFDIQIQEEVPQIQVSELEKDVKELKQVDYSSVILSMIISQVPYVVNEYLGSSLGDSFQKKDILFIMMLASKAYEKHHAYKALYGALIKSLFVDEDDMDQAAGAMGNTPPKTFKSGKSLTAKEPDKEHMHDMTLDAEENIVDEMGNADEQPDGEAVPNTDNTPKNDWFKQPPRPPTLDLEWNKCQILSVVSVTVNKLHGYCYLEEIMVRRADRQLYKFKEGDFVNLHLNDIKDMLLLVVQHKLFHLNSEVIVDLAMALRLFTRSLIIKKRVKDVQLGVERYQKKLSITKPQKDFPRIFAKELYTS
nr:hypothetical protein [Tanacetum cinerariifolium]